MEHLLQIFRTGSEVNASSAADTFGRLDFSLTMDVFAVVEEP
jgi:hypothetical protein